MARIVKSLFVLILLSVNMADALACSCLNVPTQQRYSEANAIFLGQVVETKMESETQTLSDQAFLNHRVRAKVLVTKTIKGKNAEYIDVLDHVVNGANCGVGLLTGLEYLFYLHEDESISICNGTKLYNEFSDKNLIDELMSY